MAVTPGRNGFQQTVDNAAWETIFDVASGNTFGCAMRGVELNCITQNVDVEITGVHNNGGVLALSNERLVAGAIPVQRWGFVGDTGLITKIRAKSAVAGGVLTWNVISSGR